MAEEQVKVENNPAAQQYEVHADGHLAVLTYERTGDRITFTHTRVPDALERRGIGSALAKAALNDARAEGLGIIPQCPFVRSYIERHAEYQPLVVQAA